MNGCAGSEQEHKQQYCGFHGVNLTEDDGHYKTCGQILDGSQRFSSSALLTTETELIAIAAPAITGLSIPNIASGMPSTL